MLRINYISSCCKFSIYFLELQRNWKGIHFFPPYLLKTFFPALVVYLFASYACLYAQKIISYQHPEQLLEMGSYARFFEDTTNQLTHKQVSQLPNGHFTDSPDKILNLGFSQSRIWLKWDIQNKTGEQLYAILEAQDIDYVDAYVVCRDTSYYLETGVLRPFSKRYFDTNSIVLNLGQEPMHLYIALKDMNGLVLPIKLGTIRPIMNKIYRETMINAFVTGILALIALFSFFMFLSLGDRTFLLYALHVVFSGLTLLTFEGYLSDILWREMPYMNNGINSSLIRLGTLLTSIAFSVAFLNVREILPRLAQFYKGAALVGSLVVFSKILGIQQAEMVFNLIVLITFLSFLGVGVWMYRRGYQPARFYLLGWGIYIVEILLLVLTLFNVLAFDHFFTYYGYQIGAAGQAVFLTFAVMDRINTLRINAHDAQELAMTRMQEHDKLLARHNEVLDQQLNRSTPPDRDDLNQLVKLFRDEREKVRKIPIPTLEGVLLFVAEDIIRIEAMGSYTNIHFVNRKEMVASRSLAEFEQVLTEYDEFFRVHKSHLVNLNYITRYQRGDGGTLMMTDGSEVDVARRIKSDFLKKMGMES
jgi:two-component system, sensor histidine kinase LadS